MDHPLLPLADWFIGLPHIFCPTCSRGHLEKSTDFTTQLSGQSLREREYAEDWDPDWIRGVFVGILTCSLTHCSERVAIVGDYEVVYMDTRSDASQEYAPWVSRYRLRFARPAPLIVNCPPRTPPTVQNAAMAAATVIWTDPAGAAGRLRVAVEELMTAQRISRSKLENKKGGGQRRVPRTAHERIKEFELIKPDVAGVLMAVKWIGNSGSHKSGLSVQDVLDGAQMLSLALRLLYDPSDAELLRRAALVNRHRGPARRKAIVTSGP
ncbi:DUF4145 domain-containing protein [Melissospora conviva]|uniref:DUF4145 domain-containing protein n=1 Tax=Melissospora conviva TaxID=3388432 RepID=UPI003B761401